MKAVIAGASGFIGSALSEHLRDLQDDKGGADTVVNLVRMTPGDRSNPVFRDLSPVRAPWNPNEGVLDPSVIADCDAVIVLNGAPIIGRRWTNTYKRRLIASRLDPVRTVVQAIAKLPEAERPRRLITGSAVGYYGSRSDELLTEDAAPGSDFLAKLCGRWEAEGERVTAYGVAHTALRTGLVFGEDGGMYPLLATVFKAGLGGRLGSGAQWMPTITIRDYVRAVAHIIDHEISGPVNMVASEPIRNRDFTRIFAAHLHKPAVAAVPECAIRAVLGEASAVALSSQRCIPEKLHDSGFVFESPDFEAIAAELLHA
ncbi:MAG: TIGR01777 family oxidoreductase [Actinomycetaceae bacterium]|nr:TIGR01777 family oxidoreductase [Arcanobacterium sp.]MDD7505068.1 TIGR01777 family oxidoreductase [Actinomycetaceae bacterium]MDY6143759.1 TIGR01777 family oxidoreductase [Arcanobacterium sp.]